MSKYTKVKIKVPDINRTFVSGAYNYSKSQTIVDNRAMMNTIYRSYGIFINRWGTEFEVDDSVLVGFIATESGGKNAPPNKYKATGLMQMTPDAVWETIAKWEKMVGSPLSKTATAFFNKIIPSSKNYDPNVLPSSAVESEILNALQNNSEFNIAIGTAHLRWLLEAFAENNQAEINKVMVSYNAGYYSSRNKVKGKMTTTQMVSNKSFALESRGYLLKMLGVNGFMHLWFKKKK